MKAVLDDNGYIWHHCPGCKRKHVVPIKTGSTKDWEFNGDLENPTLMPSVKHYYPESFYEKNPYAPRFICHYHITNGNIIYCSDCTHECNGKTIELPEINSLK